MKGQTGGIQDKTPASLQASRKINALASKSDADYEPKKITQPFPRPSHSS
jgi:hypothetical protein